jgi:hypothetical protein
MQKRLSHFGETARRYSRARTSNRAGMTSGRGGAQNMAPLALPRGALAIVASARRLDRDFPGSEPR